MKIRRLCLPLLLTVVLPAAMADTISVYKWIDAEGITHYAESRPAAHNAQQLELESAPAPTPSPTTDYYAIVNQARRLEQARLARERERAQQQAAALQAEREAAQQAAALAAAEFYRQQDAPAPAYYVPFTAQHHRFRHQHPTPDHHRHPPLRGDRDPAYTPPAIWLRSHPRLLRQERRAQRDREPVTADRTGR